MARVITAFAGVIDGEVHPTEFQPGDTLTGDLARVALAEGWAEAEETEAEAQEKAAAAEKAAAKAAKAST